MRVKLSVLMLGCVFGGFAVGAEPYPALPPALSTSVTPNVLLFLDNSGSMADPPSGSTQSKMAIAQDVAKTLMDQYSGLRWGLFSFNEKDNDTGGKLKASVGSSISSVKTAVDALTPATWTPLGEAAYEMSRYWSGSSSYYQSGVSYSSPIQYRCQKNFNVIITDGFSTRDKELPGVGSWAAETYKTFDTAGTLVTKTFRVCSSTSTSSSVTCPAKLEGSAVNNNFIGTPDDSTTYGRSLRDVAMFSADKDMRAGGTDLDGKSFDDPAFQKQGVNTFTIGFAVDDPVLEAAAQVGGGTYSTANDKTSLIKSLGNVMSSIGDMTSNGGGLAVKGDTISAGNKVFQPVFNPKGWYGELRCFNSAGTLSSSSLGTACSPAGAVIPAAASRKIYSGKVVSGVTTTFDFTTSNLSVMTAAQQASLGSAASSGAEQKNVISFVRGEAVSGMRTRSNGLLGDIIDSQPLVVAAPTGSSSDSAYAAFVSANAARAMVFVGANDGMLHGFRISDMTELSAYIPSVVYRNLKSLTDSTYGDSAGVPHAYFVNGSLKKSDVKVSSGWKTLMVGGLAQGGQGYFGMDVTNEATVASRAVAKWEWTDANDADMGYTFADPIIYNVRTSASTVVPAVILANGYENDFSDTVSGGQVSSSKSSALYILNADTGALIKKIKISYPGITSQGLSSPAGLDIGQDGILDYVYAGDINGNMWRFDLTANSPADFTVSSEPLFKAGQPIVQRPAVVPVTKTGTNTVLGHMVIFGTGKLLVDADRSDTAVNSVYGVLDTMDKVLVPVSKTELVSRTVTDEVGGYRKVSASPVLDLASGTSAYKGWSLTLPSVTEKLVTAPLALADRLIFGTGIPLASEKCVPGGTGWIMGLNPLTGATVKNKQGNEFSFVDVNGDNKSTEADKVGFGTGKAFVNGVSVEGIPTELSFIAKTKSTSTPADTGSGSYGSAGSVIALEGSNVSAVFTGGNPSGNNAVPTGKPMAKPDEGGTTGGSVCFGLQGKSLAKCLGSPSSSSGVKLESTLWRELKN